MSDAGGIAMRELLRQLEVVEGQRDKAIELVRRFVAACQWRDERVLTHHFDTCAVELSDLSGECTCGIEGLREAYQTWPTANLLAEMENQDA